MESIVIEVSSGASTSGSREVAETPKDRYTTVVVTWAGVSKAAGIQCEVQFT